MVGVVRPQTEVLLLCACCQVIEKREEVDWKRHGVFISFGLFYLVSQQHCSHRSRFKYRQQHAPGAQLALGY